MLARTTDKSQRADLLDVLNTLNAARNLNEALSLAARSRDVPMNTTNALQSLTTEIERKLESAADQLQELLEESNPVEKSNSGEN
jgi:hypothetical protein